jgi:hypothetical protein
VGDAVVTHGSAEARLRVDIVRLIKAKRVLAMAHDAWRTHAQTLQAELDQARRERDEARRAVCERAALGRPGHESEHDYDSPEDAADTFGWLELYPDSTATGATVSPAIPNATPLTATERQALEAIAEGLRAGYDGVHVVRGSSRLTAILAQRLSQRGLIDGQLMAPHPDCGSEDDDTLRTGYWLTPVGEAALADED